MARKLTEEEVIERAWIKHCGRYTYRDLVYLGNKIKSWITCLIHGNFLQKPNDHLSGYGCPKCAGVYTPTTKEYIQNVLEKYPENKEKYGYSEVLYKDNRTKIKIFCNTCDKYFIQRPNSHLNGQGCPECGIKQRSESTKSTLKDIVKKAKKIHGEKYGYEESNYNNFNTKMKIYCNTCNKYFWQSANSHLKGYGCSKCSGKYSPTTKEYIETAQNIHGKEKYGYSEVDYKDNKTKIKICCNACNKYFWQSPSEHLRGCGCPRCKESKGQKQITKILKENNINFENEKKFETCKNKKTLPFDFYLYEYNILIEYDGEQHFKPGRYSKDKEKNIKKFKEIKNRDQIKTQWCKDNNIPLIRISYKQYSNIEEKINKLIKLLRNNIL